MQQPEISIHPLIGRLPETFSDKLLKTILADSLRFSASDGQELEKTEILR